MFEKIRAWFHDSETIVFARLQLALGTLGQIAVQMDWTPFLPDDPKWQFAAAVLTAWLIASGAGTEWARRRRATDL